MKRQISPRTIKHCLDLATVGSEISKDSSLSPEEAAKILYGPRKRVEKPPFNDEPASDDDLEKAHACGTWGKTEPGDLFLRIYHDVLCCLNEDPLVGMVSPPLMGACGSIPLTIIAPLVDITRHCSNLIVRASKEVILSTCSWLPSESSALIGDALKELSRRAGARNERVAVKIMFDKAGPAHLLNSHQRLSPEIYCGSKMRLPHPKDTPHIDMEVLNLHQPLLGTLHAKFMVVDRKIGIVQSNNMEDNCNLEMMTHLQGAIVDSLYDYALITWRDCFTTPSPMNARPDRSSVREEIFPPQYTPVLGSSVREDEQLPGHRGGDPHYDPDLAHEMIRIQSMCSPRTSETPLSAVNRHLNDAYKTSIESTGPQIELGNEFQPYIKHVDSTIPIAMVCRRPYGRPNNSDTFNPQAEAWLSCIRNAKSSIFVQTPDLNASPLENALINAIKRGVDVTYWVSSGYNDAGEQMPGQGGINETFSSRLYSLLSENEKERFHIHWYVAKDQVKPISHTFRHRDCHIKLLIADGQVGIQGSGNQDTQSWCHSQEVNIMVDSEAICRDWKAGIERNQNTAKFGLGSLLDGIWRDDSGRTVEGATAISSTVVGWVQGFVGMARKAKEKGGFG